MEYAGLLDFEQFDFRFRITPYSHMRLQLTSYPKHESVDIHGSKHLALEIAHQLVHQKRWLDEFHRRKKQVWFSAPAAIPCCLLEFLERVMH